MKTMTLRDVEQEPVGFLRLMRPVCTVLPHLKHADRFPLFDILNKPDQFAVQGIYKDWEVLMALADLEAEGYERLKCDPPVRILAKTTWRKITGTDLYKRGFVMRDLMIVLHEAAWEDTRRFQKLLKVVEAHLQDRPVQPGNNSPALSSQPQTS